MMLAGKGAAWRRTRRRRDPGCNRRRTSILARAGRAGGTAFARERRTADHEAARLLYARAAKNGHSGAMFSLGALHGGGHDIPANPEVALFWYQAAAARGHPMAALMLGKFLVRGIATRPDPAAARVWLLRAAENGVDVAAELRGSIPPRRRPIRNHDWRDKQGSASFLKKRSKTLF